ncbi:helix-turn-helix domain-containing protein [Pedobacter frigidisoli]|uniref:winged helix-turn-helix transcriptional regulator n=1 Tax=Pedobacter frigidisoli TaxID=2530455 RepID=UPI002931DEC8|nr:helix-turn-helix domain-containing protein [Pedobacter frigidisoli]
MLKPIKIDHKESILAIHDALEILSRKWTVSIIFGLAKHNKLCFKELKFHLIDISAKVLSYELKELEQNLLISRTSLASNPPKVEYELTEYGMKLEALIFPLLIWGLDHRERILCTKKHSTEEYVDTVKKNLCSCMPLLK